MFNGSGRFADACAALGLSGSVPSLRFKLHVIGTQGSSTLAPYTCVSRSSHALSLCCPIGCCWALVCTAGLVCGVVVTLAAVSGLAGFG